MPPNLAQQMEQIATKVYQKLGSRFGVNQTPTHTHNNIDSNKIDPTSLTNTTALSVQAGGTFSAGAPTNSVNVVFPIPVVGVKPVNAGPVGTLVYNTGTSPGLYIYLSSTGWTII